MITRLYFNSTDGTTWNSGQGADPYKDMFVALPNHYDSERATPYPVVVGCPGRTYSPRAWDIDDAEAGATHTWVAEYWLARGYIFVGGAVFETSSFGNQDCLDILLGGINYVLANYNTETEIILHGSSMGGDVALNLHKQNPTLAKALLFIYPVSNLNDHYDAVTAGNSDFTAYINTAFDGTTFGDTAGYRPEEFFSNYAAAGVPIKIYHGDSDITVNPDQSTALRDAVNAIEADLVSLEIIAGGTHGSQSIFDAYAANAAEWVFASDLDLALLTNQFDLDLTLVRRLQNLAKVMVPLF